VNTPENSKVCQAFAFDTAAACAFSLALGIFNGSLGAVVPVRRTAFFLCAPSFEALRSRILVSFRVFEAMGRILSVLHGGGKYAKDTRISSRKDVDR
jgi:hypothetical protein